MNRRTLARTAAAASVLAVSGLIGAASPSSAGTTAASEACDIWTQSFSTRYTVTEKSEVFLALGAISTANKSDKPLNLYQSLYNTKTLTASANVGVSYSGISGGLGASYSESWTTGQGVGPYEIKPGETGRATYGFNVVRFKGTAQTCLPWGQWSSPKQIWGLAPIGLHVVMERYPNGEAPPTPVGIPVDQAMSGLKAMSK